MILPSSLACFLVNPTVDVDLEDVFCLIRFPTPSQNQIMKKKKEFNSCLLKRDVCYEKDLDCVYTTVDKRQEI